MAEEKLSAYPPVDATATLEVSKDRTEAYIKLFAPQHGGAAMTLQQLAAFLQQKGIVHGIDKERLQDLSVNPQYGSPVLIAKGQSCVNGVDAELTYYVQLKKDLRPKERPDGSVDFRDLGLIEHVKKDALLCEKKPATQGTPGTDVFGAQIPAKPGKEKTMPAGRNTVLSEDKLKLYAAIDGQSDYLNNKIIVLDTFTVDGNVSTATGDIDFTGNVTVKGGVMSGFSINAGGNVDITGIVESAKITAGGNIIIRNGFNGGDGGMLHSDANITCRYIQGGRVTLAGNLETTYIMNSTVLCGGAVNVTGKGLILGGRVTALSSVTANLLGSGTATTSTEVAVGSDPILVKRSQEIPKELINCDKDISRLQLIIQTMTQLKAAGRLTPDKAEIFEKTLSTYSYLLQQKTTLEEENEVIKEKMAEMGFGFVRVFKSAYPGVKIIIGAEQLPLQSEYSYTCFKRVLGSGITCSPAN